MFYTSLFVFLLEPAIFDSRRLETDRVASHFDYIGALKSLNGANVREQAHHEMLLNVLGCVASLVAHTSFRRLSSRFLTTFS